MCELQEGTAEEVRSAHADLCQVIKLSTPTAAEPQRDPLQRSPTPAVLRNASPFPSVSNSARPASSCCVGTHAEITRMTLGVVVDDGWRDGRHGDKATATAILLESLTRDPHAAA